jgi:enoyl-[acyl-carrier protein] reductase II
MLTTPLCPLLGIEVPIILAPMDTCTSAELAAAVSNAGGLGGIGTVFRSFAAIKRDIDMAQRLTQRPFAIITSRRRSMPKRFATRCKPARRLFHSRWPTRTIWCGKRTTPARG